MCVYVCVCVCVCITASCILHELCMYVQEKQISVRRVLRDSWLVPEHFRCNHAFGACGLTTPFDVAGFAGLMMLLLGIRL